MIEAQLPALIILGPLFSGLLAAFSRGRTTPWLSAAIGGAISFAAACWTLARVRASEGGFLQYEMGAWPAEYGIALRLDAAGAWMTFIVAGMGLLCTLYARRSIEDELPAKQHPFFWCVWQLALCGLLGMLVTGDAFNLYVLLEISSLTLYTLIAVGRGRDRRALTASLRYLLLGSIGATFLLIGIGYLLMLTGTLNMIDMREQLDLLRDEGALTGHRTLAVAIAFLSVGVALKAAVWPLHGWLPDCYTYAPSAVSALVAATATKVAAFLGLRFLYTILGDLQQPDEALHILLAAAALGIVITSVQALRAANIKRVLAYSSVGQVGYLVLGLGLPDGAGLHASLLHAFNHAITKGAMFMAVGVVVLRLGGSEVRLLRGLGRRMPWTMAAFTLGGLGLVGMPGTAGFLSKWLLLEAALEQEAWIAVIAVGLGGALALAYVWRLVELIWFQVPDGDSGALTTPQSMALPLWILITASVVFGIWADFPISWARDAADCLRGVQP